MSYEKSENRCQLSLFVAGPDEPELDRLLVGVEPASDKPLAQLGLILYSDSVPVPGRHSREHIHAISKLETSYTKVMVGDHHGKASSEQQIIF